VDIKSLDATTILNSVGNPTVKVAVKTENGCFSSSVPEGTSAGRNEFAPLPPNKSKDYINKIKIGNISSVNDIIDLEKKHESGKANILGLSLCLLKAVAASKNRQVYELFGKKTKPFLLNKIVGGGAHAGGHPEVQEFLAVVRSKSIKEGIEISHDIHKDFGKHVKPKGRDLEGGWAVNMASRQVLSLMEDTISSLGLKKKVSLGMDIAASSFYKNRHYICESGKKTKEEYMEYVAGLVKDYKISFIEDPFDEDDFESFAWLKKKFPNVLVCGDDLVVTNPDIIIKAHSKKSINSVIVKPNQVGYIYKLIEFCRLADKYKYLKVVSHRSQETNDPILADLGVGLGCQGMKMGIFGGERIAKLNRLVEIFG